MCTFRLISALAWGDKNDKDIHRHTSTCLVERRSLGVPIINVPSSPHHLPTQSCVCPCQAGDVLLGTALSVCRLILNFSAAAVGFLSGRSGLKRARRLSSFAPLPPCPLLPPSQLSSCTSLPFSFRPQILTLSGSFPARQSWSTVRGAPGVGDMKRH